MPIQLMQPLHAAILVSDLDKAAHFYGDVLGLAKVNRTLKYPGAWYQLGDYQIHLIVDESAPSGLHNAAKWGRNRHIAFAVKDVQTAKTQLVDQGFEVQMSASGRAALFIQDPDGNVIELSELS